MTTQAERNPLPAGPQSPAPEPAGSTNGERRRRIVVLWCTVAALAVGGVLMVSNPGHLLPGLGQSNAKPAEDGQSVGAAGQPLTEAQAFTVDRYFPAQRGIDQDGYKARRTAARQAADCAETLTDRAHDLFKDAGCQGYLALSFTRVDQPVLTSVTVLRFNDEAAATKAAARLDGDPGPLAFVLPDGVPAPPTASASPAAPVKPLTTHRTSVIGHYVTITVSRYADLRPGPAADQPALDEATRAAVFAANAPFLWM